MKTLLLLPLASLGLLSTPTSAANLLVNSDFELGNMSGWTVNGGVIGQPGVGAQSGSFSSLLNTTGNGVPTIDQTFAATAGQEFNFSGYLLTQATMPPGPSFGLLKIVFRSGATDLQVTQASIGTIVGPANPGVETIQVNNSSPLNTWIFAEAQATAPVGTDNVLFIALDVEFNGGNHPVYVDNMQATLVPEPSSVALGALGGLALLARRRSR